MPHPSRRRAFTRVEFVVVAIIIAVAITFFIMVIPRAGGAAYLNSCRNNQRLIGIALSNYQVAHRVFPPLYYSNDPALKERPPLSPLAAAASYSWQTRLLPFLEQPEFHRELSAASQKFTLPSTDVKVPGPGGAGTMSPREVIFKQLRCPAVPDAPTPGNGNYAATSVTRLPLLTELVKGEEGVPPAFKREPDGVIVPEHGMNGISPQRMQDGSSKTILVIESREAARSDWYDPQQSFVAGFVPADSTPIDEAGSNYYPYFAPDWTFNPTAGNRTALNYGPTAEKPDQAYNAIKGDPLERTWGPSSAHEGGVVLAVMGDLSVQEIWPDVDPRVFFAAITARGSETVPSLPPPKLP